jgi:cardiolipin synthase
MYEPLHPSFHLHESQASNVDADHFAVVPSAHLFFEELKEKIKQASESVDLQFYTFEADPVVSEIIKVCTEAAERGVDVRILVDHIVSDPRRLLSTMRANRTINASPNMQIRRSRVATGLANIAVRDHKKIAAIDTRAESPGGYSYIGGVNLAERSLRWNDFMVQIQGSASTAIQHDFDQSWAGNGSKTRSQFERDPHETLLLADTGEDEQIVSFAYEHIAQASERIWLETPYLDMEGIGAALCLAKKDNPELDVRVIIPRFNNYPVDRFRTKKACRTLQDAGVDAHLYGVSYRRLNHAKMLLIDDMAMFGSSNYNTGKMAGGNAEIAIATNNPSLVGQLEQWYNEDTKESIAV